MSVIRAERLKGLDIRDTYVEIPADLAVEVVSPSDNANGVIDKVEDYLSNGFPLVWVIYPTTRSVAIFRAGGGTAYLHENDEITGEAALPSFRCKVGEFFAGTRAES